MVMRARASLITGYTSYREGSNSSTVSTMKITTAANGNSSRKNTMCHMKKRTSLTSLTAGLPDDAPLFFFKPNEPLGEFCQWYPANFTVSKAVMSSLVGHPIDETDPEGWNIIYFNCAEQFMMYCKAGRFRDIETQRKVLATQDPKEQKRLGRLITGFQDASWDEIKSDVVLAGNMAKFEQNPKLKKLLLQTGDRVLAEAASLDRVWGIGYTAHEALVYRNNWGENRLGKALMEVRERLRREDEDAGSREEN